MQQQQVFGYDEQAVREAAQRYSKAPGVFSYGTAGFRTKADKLEAIMFRVGCLAALRSLKLKGKHVGVMVTASHNPEEDNGVKIVDPDGEMLAMEWETYATLLANTESSDLADAIKKIISSDAINTVDGNAKVVIGRDTRASSPSLASAVSEGIRSLKGEIIDLGETTTPQLHFAVRSINRGKDGSLEVYYNELSTAFKFAIADRSSNKEYNSSLKSHLLLDCANGVGHISAKQLKQRLEGIPALRIEIINDGTSGKLNEGVGADFVKVRQCIPSGVSVDNDIGKKIASLDGDADRLVYYFIDSTGKFNLLDGDKISALFGLYLKEELDIANISDFKIGVVQTAYANGASTHFIEHIAKVPVVCAKTGVKFLHHEAIKFDIGIYFEANGHGTIYFNEEKYNRKLEEEKARSDNSEQKKGAIERLLNLPRLVNQAVGDALSDMLLVETILIRKDWSLKEWSDLYTDLPNRQRIVRVKDRTIVQTVDAERRVSSPAELQVRIDETVRKYNKGRSFVRPSGTEDVVRVYAEADTQEAADSLASDVVNLVSDIVGGIGPTPCL